MGKIKILFVCKDNSVRSQIAEAIVNHFFGDRYEAHSAGIEPLEINPYLAKVMSKIGINISKQYSKGLKEFQEMEFDVIMTLCDYVLSCAPPLPKAREYLHINFKEHCLPVSCDYAGKLKFCLPESCEYLPKHFSKLSKDTASEEEIISYFHYLRERIFDWFEKEAIF